MSWEGKWCATSLTGSSRFDSYPEIFYAILNEKFQGDLHEIQSQKGTGRRRFFVLKKRDLHECTALYELMSDPTILPFVRHKAYSADEYWFQTKQIIEEEFAGKVVSRTITSDFEQPIGTINLFDIQDGAGFLGTWIGTAYQGLGYNKKAKEQFLEELFFELNIHTVFLRIRKNNIKSKKATEKLRYALKANDSHPLIYQEINKLSEQFDLYYIPKDLFYLTMLQQNVEEEQAM